MTVADQFSGAEVTTQDFVTMDNGVYYVLDQMVQPTFHSLMQELVEHSEYSEFYELLLGNEEWTTNESNLYSLISTKSLNMNEDNAAIQTFSSYHYTVYVPDNTAMEKLTVSGYRVGKTSTIWPMCMPGRMSTWIL